MQNFNWKYESQRSVAIKIILFLLSPVLGLLYSLKSLNTKSTHAIIFLFCLCFGLAFTVTNVRTEGSIDGISYRAKFEESREQSYESFTYDLKDYVTFDGSHQDFYFNTLAFTVSRFTSNYHIFFLFVALIFSFFQLRTLRFFTSHANFSNTLFCLILFLLFTWNQIFNINGLRFWTAAWIAVYAAFQLFVGRKRKYLLLALITPFVHGSYFIYLIVILLYYLTGKYKKLWVVLFLASFAISTIAVELTRDLSSFLPKVFADKTEFYTDTDYILKRTSGSGFWFLDRFFSTLSTIYVNILVLILAFKSNKIKNKDSVSSFLIFLLVLMTVSNVFMPIPSVGGRFIQLCYPMIAYLWLSNFSDKKYSWIIYCLPIVWFMNIYYMALHYMSVLDISFFVASPIYSTFKYLVFL